MALWEDLGIPTTDTADFHYYDRICAHLSQTQILLPSISQLQDAKAKVDGLETEKRQRETVIQSIYDDLFVLWARLGIPEQEQEAFLEQWKGIEERCVEAVSL